MRQESNAADVFISVLLAESKTLAKVLSDYIPVDYLNLQTVGQKLCGNGSADRRFSSATKTRKPNREALPPGNAGTCGKIVQSLLRQELEPPAVSCHLQRYR